MITSGDVLIFLWVLQSKSLSQRVLSFDDSGDVIIPIDARLYDPRAVLIDDFPDDASESYMSVKPPLDMIIISGESYNMPYFRYGWLIIK